mgnify:CR=1 FL=1
MTWKQTRLTTREEEDALRAAGIPLDPAAWTAGNVQRAATALDAAQAAKVARASKKGEA